MSIGQRIGQRWGQRLMQRIGAAAIALSFIGFGFLRGQSNEVGNAQYLGTGTATSPGGDSGFKFDQPFPACTLNQNSATAPANPMVFNINTGNIALQTYAGAGTSNMGLEQSLGRDLVNYGVFANPVLCKLAVVSSSIPANWVSTSLFPASGEKLYDHQIAYGNARMAEQGRKFEFGVDLIGETDCATPARVTSCIADRNQYWNEVMDAWGLPNTFLIVMVMINPAQAAGNPTGYRLQQQAWAAQWTRCPVAIVDPADIPIPADPHYVMNGYADIGSRVAIAIANYFKPGLSLDRGTGPGPWLQQAAAGYTSQASPSVARPRDAAQTKAKDLQILASSAATANVAITLTTANGFTALNQFQSTFATGPSLRTLGTWTRTADATTMAANNGHMPPPVVDSGTATLNVSNIYCFRSTGTPSVDTSTTGVNNGNTTTVVIPGGTTSGPNRLLALIACTGGLTNGISSIVTSGLTWTIQRDSRFNAGAGTIGMALATAPLPAQGSWGSTTVTFLSTGVNAATIIAVAP